MGRPYHGCPCGQSGKSRSKYDASSASSTCAAVTTPTSQSGSVFQSQSIEKLRTTVRRQFVTSTLESCGMRSEFAASRRGGRRKTSVAPAPSSVKSAMSATTSPCSASKQL